MCDHVVHSASKYHELINILTNAEFVNAPKAETCLTNPLLISTKTRLPTLNKLYHNERDARNQQVQWH